MAPKTQREQGDRIIGTPAEEELRRIRLGGSTGEPMPGDKDSKYDMYGNTKGTSDGKGRKKKPVQKRIRKKQFNDLNSSQQKGLAVELNKNPNQSK